MGPTAFNLLGIDRWVRNFRYLVCYDSWDGVHPRVFSPKNKPFVEFESSEQINNYLPRDPEVQAHVASRVGSSGVAPMIAMVFFDKETEQICEELGYNLILPPDSLRRHLDSRIVTTRLGEQAGAPSVPNVVGRSDSYAELAKLAADAGLGSDLVVQTPYGDSGKTTFFIDRSTSAKRCRRPRQWFRSGTSSRRTPWRGGSAQCRRRKRSTTSSAARSSSRPTAP